MQLHPPPKKASDKSMSQFSFDAVEALDYDFTGFPSNSKPKAMCKGKGVIPEPSQPRLEAYSQAMRELYKVKDVKDVTEAMDADERATKSREEEKERSDKLLALTAELCQNTPSKAELSDLPPRICRAFMKWIFRELADPEVSSAGIRR